MYILTCCREIAAFYVVRQLAVENTRTYARAAGFVRVKSVLQRVGRPVDVHATAGTGAGRGGSTRNTRLKSYSRLADGFLNNYSPFTLQTTVHYNIMNAGAYYTYYAHHVVQVLRRTVVVIIVATRPPQVRVRTWKQRVKKNVSVLKESL